MGHFWISLSLNCPRETAEELRREIESVAQRWASRHACEASATELHEDWLSLSPAENAMASAEMANQEITSGPSSW